MLEAYVNGITVAGRGGADPFCGFTALTAPGEAQPSGIGREVAGAGFGCHRTIVRTPGAGEVSRAHPAD